MKLQPDRVANHNLISGYTPLGIQVAERTWQTSLVLPWRGDVVAWNADRFDVLDSVHFDLLAEMSPEIVLFGSGSRLRFPKPEWLKTLMQQRIGFETMDTPAACRTYNLLLAEGRKVVAALLIEAL